MMNGECGAARDGQKMLVAFERDARALVKSDDVRAIQTLERRWMWC